MPEAIRQVSLPLLDSVHIASPCPMRWEDMRPADGERDRRRFCDHCSLHVHNIAALTRDEAETLLRESLGQPGGSICAQLHRRADGTILTRDCPVGRAALLRRAAARVVRMAGFLACALAAGVTWAASESRPRLRTLQPFEAVATWIHGTPPVPTPAPIRGEVFLGKMCAPTAVQSGSASTTASTKGGS